MRTRTILLIFGRAPCWLPTIWKRPRRKTGSSSQDDDRGGPKLEKAGQLAEARIKYAESQALIEVKDVTDALKRLDEEIRKRVKDALNESRKLYESRKFKEAAARWTKA